MERISYFFFHKYFYGFSDCEYSQEIRKYYLCWPGFVFREKQRNACHVEFSLESIAFQPIDMHWIDLIRFIGSENQLEEFKVD